MFMSSCSSLRLSWRSFHSFIFAFIFITLASTAPVASLDTQSAIPAGVPDYVVNYAPLVYLHSQDNSLPSDIGAQLQHTVPKIGLNSLPSNATLPPLTLDNLQVLNQYGTAGSNVYMTSKDDASKFPQVPWLNGVAPDADGKVPDAKTCAVIVVDKGNGMVDAFYVMFWAFNWGGMTLGQNLGDHIGDWEHVMVRFQDGVPKLVWLSQHASGQAFDYPVLANRYNSSIRPVAFAANGSHAFYAIDGVHDHTIPQLHFNKPGVINDYCDTGKLYDPIKSAYWYSWTPSSGNSTDASSALGTFTPYDAATPTGYLYYAGHWGDARYPNSDPRQHNLINQFYKFEDGPTGPAFKDLNRKDIWSGSNHQVFNKLVPRYESETMV